MPTIVPSAAMNSMSSGKQVFFIQNERTCSWSQEKIMPWSWGMLVRYIRPRVRDGSSPAISTWSLGCPGAAGKTMLPFGRANGPVGSAGQFAAGVATGGACAGGSTRQRLGPAVGAGAGELVAVGPVDVSTGCGPGEL